MLVYGLSIFFKAPTFLFFHSRESIRFKTLSNDVTAIAQLHEASATQRFELQSITFPKKTINPILLHICESF